MNPTLGAIIVQMNHEASTTAISIAVVVGIILLGVIIAIGCSKVMGLNEFERSERARAERDIEVKKSEAKIAEAQEKQVNGRGPDDYMRMADATNQQAEAMERFLIAQTKMDAFFAAKRDYEKSAKDLVS